MINQSIKTYAEKLGNQDAVKYASLYEAISQKEKAEIVLVGEFSNGKSTLLNALIGKDMLPTGIGATTSKITYLQKGEANKILCSTGETYFKDKNAKSIIYNSFSTCQENEISIHFKDFIFNDFKIVDTPGINDADKDREFITYEYAPKADAMVFVLDASRGFTRFEKEFFEGLSDTSKDKIFIVFNKTDAHDNFSKEDMLKLLNEGKIEGLKGFAVSAKNGINGVLQNSDTLIDQSGIPDFKASLIEYVNSKKSRQTVKNRKKKLIERAYLLLKTELDANLKGIEMSFEEVSGVLKKLVSERDIVVNERNIKLDEFTQKYNQIDDTLQTLIQNFEIEFNNNFSKINGMSEKRAYLQSQKHKNNVKQLIQAVQKLLENRFDANHAEFIPDSSSISEYMDDMIDSLEDMLLLFGNDELLNLFNNFKYGRHIRRGADIVRKGIQLMRQHIGTFFTEERLNARIEKMLENIKENFSAQSKKIRNEAEMQLNQEVEKIDSTIAGFEKIKKDKENETKNLQLLMAEASALIEQLNNSYNFELSNIN